MNNENITITYPNGINISFGNLLILDIAQNILVKSSSHKILNCSKIKKKTNTINMLRV